VAKLDFGKGSKKRRLAAIKAARTRKKNAVRKKKNPKQRRKITKGELATKISRFVETKLVPRIIEDLRNNLISSEADLQASVAYHLREICKSFTDARISSQLPIRIRKNVSDIFVDLVVSKIVPQFAIIEPVVAIELKEHQEIVDSDARKDISKLQKLRTLKIIKYGYLIYLCRSQYKETELQDEVERIVKTKYAGRIKPIVINIYDHITGTERTLFDKRWEQTKRYELSKATAKKAVKTRKRRSKN